MNHHKHTFFFSGMRNAFLGILNKSFAEATKVQQLETFFDVTPQAPSVIKSTESIYKDIASINLKKMRQPVHQE